MKQNGNKSHQQFERMTFCHMEQLFRLAYSRVGNSHDAEDIVQETYLKAYRAFDTVREKEHLKSWLTQILINSVHDHLRKRLRTVPTVDLSDVPEESMQRCNQRSPEEELCDHELDPALLRALQSIPETYLTTLLLREIDQASYEEIASILEVPLGTVMSRLFRARQLLREKLLPDDKNDKSSDSENANCKTNLTNLTELTKTARKVQMR